MNSQKKITYKYQGLFALIAKEYKLYLSNYEIDKIIEEAKKVVGLSDTPDVVRSLRHNLLDKNGWSFDYQFIQRIAHRARQYEKGISMEDVDAILLSLAEKVVKLSDTSDEIEKEEIVKRYETFVKADTTPVFLKENVFKCMEEYAKWYSRKIF